MTLCKEELSTLLHQHLQQECHRPYGLHWHARWYNSARNDFWNVPTLLFFSLTHWQDSRNEQTSVCYKIKPKSISLSPFSLYDRALSGICKGRVCRRWFVDVFLSPCRDVRNKIGPDLSPVPLKARRSRPSNISFVFCPQRLEYFYASIKWINRSR